MKHRHILVAIHALEDKKSQINEQISYYAKFHDYHNTESREVCRLRKAEVEEALNEFKALLPAPIAKVNACLASAAPADPIPSPESPPHFSPETAQTIRDALGLYVKSAELCYPAVESLVDASPFFGPKAESKTLQKAKDLLTSARRALDEFNAAFPEEVRK